MAVNWTRAIGLALALALIGAAYGDCLVPSAEASVVVPAGDASHQPPATPSDCDGCDHGQAATDTCFAVCTGTVALPAVRSIASPTVASCAIVGLAPIALAGTRDPPDPDPPN